MLSPLGTYPTKKTILNNFILQFFELPKHTIESGAYRSLPPINPVFFNCPAQLNTDEPCTQPPPPAAKKTEIYRGSSGRRENGNINYIHFVCNKGKGLLYGTAEGGVLSSYVGVPTGMNGRRCRGNYATLGCIDFKFQG